LVRPTSNQNARSDQRATRPARYFITTTQRIYPSRPAVPRDTGLAILYSKSRRDTVATSDGSLKWVKRSDSTARRARLMLESPSGDKNKQAQASSKRPRPRPTTECQSAVAGSEPRLECVGLSSLRLCNALGLFMGFPASAKATRLMASHAAGDPPKPICPATSLARPAALVQTPRSPCLTRRCSQLPGHQPSAFKSTVDTASTQYLAAGFEVGECRLLFFLRIGD
jgi:hypothetical protein